MSVRFGELCEHPIVQAPMAGGASGPALAAAVSNAGGLGFLAAGYKTAAHMRREIDETRALTSRPFGVNLFVPSLDPVDAGAVAAYRDRLAPEAARLGVALGEPAGGDDDWDAKVADLLTDPPAVVSFTFGCPGADVITALRDRGALVVVTVTSVAEASAASDADALCVQGPEAGAHQGSFDNTARLSDPSRAEAAGADRIAADAVRGGTGEKGGGEGPEGLRALLPAVREVTDQPLIAAGGLGHGGHVAEVLALGAQAAQLGTAFLRSLESGANQVHKDALADPRFSATALTRAFSGRPARGLVNRFLALHSAYAPAAYPHVNDLTSPLRRAAAAKGDADTVALWAGTSFRLASEAPAAEIVARFVAAG
ncbi:nitronate monooxygenase [Actinomadura sp. HBU206391]|uniref:nitronate monooxygenase n=1 Tax=Actinomadura sp. HBU206391 TaxID=2731692 RepID=UPI0016504EF1|nr:nitronate monooxygenase [Actinomadura sp. HBU206391]MBC6458110.1 nitronate monooxygenase [Actinomadura sp. HBU206391]